MPALDAFIPGLLLAILLVVLLSFTFGTQRNLSRGNAIMRWLQASLPGLGRRATLRWLGSTVVEVGLVEPAEPFRDVTILAVMEPRDVPLLWAVTHARGRRDLLIFRASTRRPPRIEVEVFDDSAWITDETPDAEQGWQSVEWAGDVTAKARGDVDPATIAGLRAAWTRLGAASAGVWRVSARQTVPHLEIHVRPPDVTVAESAELIEAVRAVADALSPRR
jgi:hypothetical protein